LPYRTDVIRVRKYELGVIPDNVRAKFAALLPLMVDEQEEQQARLVATELAVREVLDANGIVGVMRVPYLNFARALFRAKGSQTGAALRKQATAEKAKSVSLGLDASILDAIIYKVIGEAAY
jgi:protein-disulfide isomerase